MARTSTVILVVLIIVTAIFLVSRRAADRSGSRATRTTTKTSAVQAERTGDGSGRTLPSKSAARTPRPENTIVTTASGLQYEVLAEGSGPRPGPTDLVQVHYQGTTLDGTVFDSSIERGKTATFPLDSVIKGWTEGLQLMPVGSRFRFTIPPELAYGERGTGSMIGPDETLVFEVELLEIPPKP